MKSGQWKGLASNEKWPMKRAGQQWKAVNEKGWLAMKSDQWKDLASNEKQPMKRLASNEKQPMKRAGLQWNAAYENTRRNEKQSMKRPAMKRAGHQWKAVNENTRSNEKQLMKSCDLQWKVIEKHKASYEKIFFIKGPGIYMIYFS